jgi:hypothetical protein
LWGSIRFRRPHFDIHLRRLRMGRCLGRTWWLNLRAWTLLNRRLLNRLNRLGLFQRRGLTRPARRPANRFIGRGPAFNRTGRVFGPARFLGRLGFGNFWFFRRRVHERISPGLKSGWPSVKSNALIFFFPGGCISISLTESIPAPTTTPSLETSSTSPGFPFRLSRAAL